MKNKKIILIFSILLIVILIGGFFAIKYVTQKKQTDIVEEYTPEEEINSEQERQTIVSLYFQDKETKKLSPEARLIDIKNLMINPAEYLISLLAEGPKSDKEELIIPENTKVLKSYFDKQCLVVDFSKEFLNYNKQNKNNLIYSIVNTLTELNEINKVKFLIDGQVNDEFSDEYARLDNL